MRKLLLAGLALVPFAAHAQTDPTQHGAFDTQGNVNGAQIGSPAIVGGYRINTNIRQALQFDATGYLMVNVAAGGGTGGGTGGTVTQGPASNGQAGNNWNVNVRFSDQAVTATVGLPTADILLDQTISGTGNTSFQRTDNGAALSTASGTVYVRTGDATLDALASTSTGSAFMRTGDTALDALIKPTGTGTTNGFGVMNALDGSKLATATGQTDGSMRASVGGFTGQAQTTPTVQTAAYSAGQVVGGLQTLGITRTTQPSGMLQDLLVAFNDAQSSVVLDALIFNANPTASTVANGGAVAVPPADIGKLIGVVHITDCSAIGTPTLCQARQQALSYVVPANGNPIYVVLVTRAALTLGSTSDITLTAKGPQD